MSVSSCPRRRDLRSEGRRSGVFHALLDYGCALVRLESEVAGLAADLDLVYGGFRVPRDEGFADFHVRVTPGRGVRRLYRPQSRFFIDGVEPFDPFPLQNALPLFEWGVNWCLAQRFNQYVLLHAGTLARGDVAVIMAAPPGSGKSTLSAAMMLRGYRLLSDEFGVLCPERGELMAMLKPVALKNRSIEVIRQYSRDAVIGPVFDTIRKGDVAHLAPNDASVDAVKQPAQPALVIFPRFDAGAALSLRRMPDEHAFGHLAFNSFNYPVLGPVGFRAIARVVEQAPAYQLVYGALDEAIAAIDRLLDEQGH